MRLFWMQQSITHQQCQSTNTNRQSSVNGNTAAQPHTHTSPPNTVTHHLTHTKLNSQGHTRKHLQCTNTLLYVQRKYTNVHRTGVTCEIREFSKCLTAHNRGAKTTVGHMIRENRKRSSTEFTKKIQTPPNVCLWSLPWVQSPLRSRSYF